MEENDVVREKEYTLSINKEMIARFIGLYLMKLDIPEDLWQFVKSNMKEQEYPQLQMFFDVVLNSFDEKDESIRKMAIEFIR